MQGGKRVPTYYDLVCLFCVFCTGTLMRALIENNMLRYTYQPLDFFRSWIGRVHSDISHSRDLMLIVYVGDFKLAGPAANIAEGCRLIRKGIITGEPEPIGRYLGVNIE